jgi:carboxypeptidase PM20D1
MLKWIKRISITLGLALLVLIAVLLVNTFRYTPEALPDSEPVTHQIDLDKAARNLSRSITFRTVSTDMQHADFERFLSYIETTYPAVHATMDRVVLDARTPLYRWQGSDDSAAPVLLAAHYDVVPAVALDKWKHDPFSGDISEGYVWGRGTLDDKGALIAILEAAEALINQGFTPNRTIYLSFGGDEEVGGQGAKSVATHLIDQGVELAWSLDEGSFVLDRVIPGLNDPVASINLAEKGYVTLTLVARSQGGHSALPPRLTAVGRVARAVDRVQSNPVPGGLTGVSEEFFDTLGRHFAFGQRVVFANRWLFNPLLENILSGAPTTDAMLRTTTAPTMLSGSKKENVLATEATATINFRIHPRDTIDTIVAHVTAAIDDDQVEILVDRAKGNGASPVSSSSAQGYLDIRSSILETFGPMATVPGLTIAATDARHYAKASVDTYRINPFKITNDDLVRFHGINERLSLENLERGIGFFLTLIQKQ